jgi:superfamily II DNA/RNA helicase
MDQKSRMETLDKFRSGDLMLLAASDVAARGLDIPDVSHIFNFDLPWQPDDYVHRIGRTGRAGKEGFSASLVTTEELKSLKDIEKMLGEAVKWIGDPPTDQDYADAGKKRRRGGGRGTGRGSARSGSARSGATPRDARSSDRGSGRGGDRRGPEKRQESLPEPQQQHRAEKPRGEQQEAQRATKPPQPQRTREQRAAATDGGQPKPARVRERAPQSSGSGFADNVPAFLRNPIRRPTKVANE